MRRIIELKHVRAKPHVRHLLDELIDRLEDKLHRVNSDAVSVHVVFEENGDRTLYRAAVTCHVPGHILVAHEERRQAGEAIRETFAEMERQLEKQKALRRHEPLLRRVRRGRAA